MSIRLRLTLLYSAILTLTLVVFGMALYYSQDQATFSEYQKTVANKAQTAVQQRQPAPPPGENQSPGPESREMFYVQTRDQDGHVVEHDPNLEASIVLPLGQQGLQEVRRNRAWEEIFWIGGERFLVRSQFVQGGVGPSKIVQVAGSLAPRDRYLNTLKNVLIFGSGIAVLATFGMGWLLAGATLRPIHRLTQAAQAIGAQRDFDHRIAHSGPNDEIGQLADTFNAMLAELQAAYQQVEQSLQAQRRFVADASHELRTPLTTLRGNIALLQRDPSIEDEDRVDVLSDMVHETERLMRLVGDLLALARADAQQSLPCVSFPLSPLIKDVCGQVGRLAPHKEIVWEAQPGAAAVGNRDALKQVLLILLDNALKHTPPETTILLTTRVLGESVAISVRDDGPGIAPAQLPHIFERFYRGDGARAGEGSGLGLAIAQELVQAQNGSLGVESQVGQGSVFTLTLPRSALDVDLRRLHI